MLFSLFLWRDAYHLIQNRPDVDCQQLLYRSFNDAINYHLILNPIFDLKSLIT